MLGRPAPATPKHSVVVLVCMPGAKTPVLGASGVNTVRQQYVPNAVVADVGSEVALPAISVLTAPTCAPPEGQLPPVSCEGRQIENVTEPVGAGPAPPLPTVTESVAAVPGETPLPDGELLLACTAVRHEWRDTGPAKSFSPAVKDWAVRVCGRKELKQPSNGMPARSMPPSRKSSCGTVVPAPRRHTQPPHGMAAAALTANVRNEGTAICS